MRVFDSSQPGEVTLQRSFSRLWRYRWILFSVVVLALGSAIYAPTRGFEFINFDDPIYVSENPWLKEGLSWESVKWAFTANLTGFSKHAEYWEPMTLLSRLLDGQFFGINPGAFHLTSVVIHLLNTCLLCFALWRLTRNWPRSAAVALLFLVHPLNVEPVCWLAARKDLVSALFFFATLGVYSWYVQSPCRRRYCALIGMYLLAIMAKPMVVTTPVILLLLDWWPLRRFEVTGSAGVRRIFLEKIPLFGMAAGAAALALISQRNWGAFNASATIDMTERLNNAFTSYVIYIRRFFWPSDLAIFYPHPRAELPLVVGIASAVALLAISAVAWQMRRRAPYFLVGWVWFCVTLAPVIGVIQVGGQAMADRYAYPSIIGILIAVVWSCAELFQRRLARLVIAGTCILTALAIVAEIQVKVWKDGQTVFAHAVQVTERNAIAYYNLGDAYINQRNWMAARNALLQSVLYEPAQTEALTNLATIEIILGDVPGAIFAYQRALLVSPKNFRARIGLGRLYLRTGRYDECAQNYVAAIIVDNGNEELYDAIDRSYSDVHAEAAARKFWEMRAASNPEDRLARERVEREEVERK